MRILIALSGGVDSTISTYLLKKQGHKVSCVIMSLARSIPSKLVSAQYAQQCKIPIIAKAYTITRKLNIPLYLVNCRSAYNNNVLSYLIDEYTNGKTPNPCIMCNRYIKFTLLPKLASELFKIKFDKFATGHYANVQFNKNLPQSYQLKRAIDRKKDQTYFLYRLTGKILSKIIFPLATYTKQEVKGIYSQLKFNIEMQKESQDLCYGKTHEILKLYCSQSKKNCGNIVNIHGNILGQHNGIWNYTIGQRKLLCTNIKQKATSLPLYVIKILPSKNEIIVSDNKLDLYSSYCTVTNVVWHIPLQTNIIHCIIKLRSQHLGAKAMIIVNKLTVKFHEPQKAITPGQSAVFYNGDYVIGGGIIL